MPIGGRPWDLGTNSEGTSSNDEDSDSSTSLVGEDDAAAEEIGGKSEDEEEAEEKYWVSVSSQRGFRRAHRAGGCHVVPGRDVKRYEWHATLEGVRFDAKCKICWDARAPVGNEGVEMQTPASSSASSGDESSSTVSV